MGSPLPDDPYLALGVAKDASAAAIKAQYRKLVLKFHPDKVQDEAQKQIASDQFHKIQTAWEVVGDEEKRQRYDAACKLAELRKDVMERQGARGSDVRTAAYKMPTDSPRGGAFYARGPERRGDVSPTYEEHKPAGYASPYVGTGTGTDYFDAMPRPSPSRKESSSYAAKRTSPWHEERTRSAKDTKEAERVKQRARTKRTDRDIRRDRDRKTAYAEDMSESDSDDDTVLPSRRAREEDQLRQARQTYHEQARRDKDTATAYSYYDGEERARKLFSQYDGAREHIEKSGGNRSRAEPERRPSPVRVSSSRDKVEVLKRSDGRPAMMRRGSSRAKPTSRIGDERRFSVPENGRRRSTEYDDAPRPPPLHQSKSSPADIKIPNDKPRAQSLQIDPPGKEDPRFTMKRAETMPHISSRDERSIRRRDNAPQTGSKLRQTEIVDGIPTPSTTPEWTAPSPTKYQYRTEYADDHEYATPEGYRTEVRQPDNVKVENVKVSAPPPPPTTAPRSRYTRSPSPIHRERESHRPSPATRYNSTVDATTRPTAPRTTSRSYRYGDQGLTEAHARPTLNRDRSSPSLFGEIPSTERSPRPSSASKYSPPPPPAPSTTDGSRYGGATESSRYSPNEVKPESYPYRAGRSSRRVSEGMRPGYPRTNSGREIPVGGS